MLGRVNGQLGQSVSKRIVMELLFQYRLHCLLHYDLRLPIHNDLESPEVKRQRLIYECLPDVPAWDNNCPMPLMPKVALLVEQRFEHSI